MKPPIRAKKKLDGKLLDVLEAEGHGPQRHEGGVTAEQLEDRAVNGVSPETGTNLNPDGTPHKASRHATRITDVESYVDAQEAIRNGPEFTAELEQRMAHGPLAPGARLEVVAKLEDVFGPDYLSKVEGITRVGGKNSPTRHGVPTDLADGTIKAIYEFDASGEWTLLTLYPDPLP